MTAASAAGILVWRVGVPAVAGLLFVRPDLQRLLLALMVFSTCHVKKPFYMEVFFQNYRGVDRGFGVTIPDLIFFGFFLFLALGGSGRRLVWWPTNTGPWLLLILVCALSISTSDAPLYGLFSLHKLIRGLVLYWVMVNVVREKQDVAAVVGAAAAAVVFQGFVVFWDKYVTGAVVNRSVGSFPHPNTLAMYVDLVIPVSLALFLANALDRRGNRLAVAGTLAGMICVVFTKSRAALVIMLAALALVVAASLITKPTVRKVQVVLAGLVVVSVFGSLAAPRIIRRFQSAPKESHETREYFNHAAEAMANENLFGVGFNAYSWALRNTHYYWYVYPELEEAEFDVDDFRDSTRGQSRLGTAHHIYLLFAGETGWIGMWVFVLFVARFYLHNVVQFGKALFRYRSEFYTALLLGTLIAFTTLHLQGLLEWIFRQTQVFYLFAVMSGLMVAAGRLQRTAPARASRRRTRLPAPAVAA